MTIIGLDLSHWQGKLTIESVERIVAQGVKFAYVKHSQGSDSLDSCAGHNTSYLQAAGIKVGAYHFVTNASALQQFNLFNMAMGFTKFDLPPALDCEAFNEYAAYGIREIVRGLSYPSQAVVDSIGMQLTTWMRAQPQMATFPYPVIYTNQSSGNRIFTSAAMSRYLLWVANWSTPGKPPITTPALPAVWRGNPYFIWQDGVVPGAPYGIDGQVDHNVWGTYMEFPGAPVPPPPPSNEIEVTIKDETGTVWAGKLQEQTA